MPFVRKGMCVYKREGGKLKKKGCSKTVEGAKRYLKALYVHAGDTGKTTND